VWTNYWYICFGRDLFVVDRLYSKDLLFQEASSSSMFSSTIFYVGCLPGFILFVEEDITFLNAFLAIHQLVTDILVTCIEVY